MNSMRNAFAIIHTWPELRNAEYEVLQRVLTAARAVGKSTVVIDDNAKILWAIPELGMVTGDQLQAESVDFMLSLHFLSPRILDVYTYITLWQPIDFYHTFGYQKSIDSVTSHNDLISCDSDLADHHGMNLLTGVGRAPLRPLPKMFHAMPEPFLQPKIDGESRLFYIGINWERLGSSKGRFHDALATLDRKGLTDIYGPEQVHGVAVWEGFQTYRGELPFDGESVKNAINQSGVCLALSSISHKNAGIMSNRLFEGLAGGAAIIATANPLIDKYFREIVYQVDDSRGEDILCQQIISALREIRGNPDEAKRRVLEGQRILRESCSLEKSIENLFAVTPERQTHHDATCLAQADVSVILTYAGENEKHLIDYIQQYKKQKRSNIRLHVICSKRFAERFQADCNAVTDGAIEAIVLHGIRLDTQAPIFDGVSPARERAGQATLEILRTINTPYFAFARLDESIFCDHYASLAKAIESTPKALAACSGMIHSERGLDKVEKRSLHSARFVDFDTIVLVDGVGQVGRFLYSSELLRQDFDELLPILDDEAHSYFRLAAYLSGPLAQTGYATYVQNLWAADALLPPVEPAGHQRQYIRDLFARDARWLDKLSNGGRIPEFVYAYSPGAPVRWNDRPPQHIMTLAPLGRAMKTCAGGEGLRYLVAGFSAPENDQVWLAASQGVIEFSIPDSDTPQLEDYSVVLRASGRASLATGRPQHCTIAVNGMVIGYVKIPEELSDIDIRLPTQLLKKSRKFRLELTPDHHDKVYDSQGNVLDARDLSIRLVSMTINIEYTQAMPAFEVNKIYKTTKNEFGATCLLSNFHTPEVALTWVSGTQGVLQFTLPAPPRSPQLRMQLCGRTSLETGNPQSATLIVNNRQFGPFTLDVHPTAVTIDLPPALLENMSVKIAIRASHAEAVYNDAHEIIDNRLLGVAICEVGLFDLSVSDRSALAANRLIKNVLFRPAVRSLLRGVKRALAAPK